MPRPHRPLPDDLGDHFTHAEALAAGVSAGRLRARDLEHPFHGVRLRPPDDEDAEDDAPQALDRRRRERLRRRAHSVAGSLNPSAFFAGMTAAAAWGAPLPDDFDAEGDLCIATPHPHRSPRGRGIRPHQVRGHLYSVDEHDGLRLSSPTSTWAMLGGELSVEWLVILGDFLVRVPRDDRGRPRPDARLATLEQLDRAARQPYRRHRDALESALARIRVGSASRLETEFRLGAAHAGLPEPALDVEIRDARGVLLGIADAQFARYGVIVEVEGDHHRTNRRQWNRDIDRLAAFAAAGWEVVRLTAARIRNGSGFAIVAAALRRHGWAPSRGMSSL